ncbi:unnamed protein product [Alopecurus aequalis]
MEENRPQNRVDQPTLQQLPDDLLRNVFHRLPSDPCAFAIVSVAFKAWRRVVHDEENFLRPFRAAHSNAPPPLLGFFSDVSYGHLQFTPSTNSGAASLPAPPPPQFHAYGCTHGRLLIHDNSDKLLLVWDPLTGDKHPIRSPPPGFLPGQSCGAALVCDADHAKHADCHTSPFLVVFAYSEHMPPDGWHAPMAPVHTFVCVYSSETRSWGDRPAATISAGSYFDWKPSAVAGNGAAVYWMTMAESWVLEFHMETQALLLTETPVEIHDMDFVLAPTMDARLGLAGVMEGSVVLFSWEDDAWVHRALVRLEALLDSPVVMGSRVVGFSEEGYSIFLKAGRRVYGINLESGQHRRVVLETDQEYLSIVYPYSSFYTAAGKAVLNDVQVDQENNNTQSGGENNVIEVERDDAGSI